MHSKRIRHVPVLEDGKLLGIVSERDLHVVEALSHCNPDEVSVHEAMVADVYTVTEDDSLDEIVEAMVDRRCGSAVILDRDHHVTGIFTATDALRVLGDVLRRVTD
jgi:acetoin utilization protein AcuB